MASLNRTSCNRFLVLVALAWSGLFVSHSIAAPPTLTPDEIQDLAVDAYVYAYPMVIMDVTRRVSTNVGAANSAVGMKAPMNQFGHAMAFPDDRFEAVVRANADTLYSSLWYDVSKEPLIVTVPDSGGRYYLLPLMDMWTDVFASPGKRTTGTGAQVFAIVGPHWAGKLPPNMKSYRSPTAIGWIIGRTQTNGVADFPAVHKFQAGLTTTTLSSWGKPKKNVPAAKVDAKQDMTAPVEQVTKMNAAEFFALFGQLLKDNPPHDGDYPILDRLAQIGIVPGKDIELNKLPPEVQKAFMAAPPIAQKKVVAAVRRAGNKVNGWRMSLGVVGAYGSDYLARAGVAYFGLGANVPEDAIYPSAFADPDGKPFDSGAKYVMHFDKDNLPPVRAFWSLTMYNDRQFFAANPIKRFAIGDRDPLKVNADGSVDLYIQRDAPDADKQSNWLPAPASGGFTMNMRLYWPKPAALDGTWAAPPVKRVD